MNDVDSVDALDVLVRRLPRFRLELDRRGARCVAWSAFAFLMVLVVANLLVQPRVIKICSKSKADIASLTIKKYAVKAYPQFRAANPERACPVTLRELNEWMNSKDIQDPWGTAYTMTCSDKGILVGSAGEDGVFDTADDVWSDK